MAEHPLLTKDRKRPNLKYLKIKTQLRDAKLTHLPHYHRHGRQGHCVQLPHHLDVVDRQDYQQERVCRQQGHVWEELRTYQKKIKICMKS